MRVCEERSDELRRRVYWISTQMANASIRKRSAEERSDELITGSGLKRRYFYTASELRTGSGLKRRYFFPRSSATSIQHPRSSTIARRVCWLSTYLLNTSKYYNVAAAKLYAVINNTNDPSIDAASRT